MCRHGDRTRGETGMRPMLGLKLVKIRELTCMCARVIWHSPLCNSDSGYSILLRAHYSSLEIGERLICEIQECFYSLNY